MRILRVSPQRQGGPFITKFVELQIKSYIRSVKRNEQKLVNCKHQCQVEIR